MRPGASRKVDPRARRATVRRPPARRARIVAAAGGPAKHAGPEACDKLARMSTDLPDIDPTPTALLMRLRAEHRGLDHAITELQALPGHEAMALQRMKKRKLQLKDCIARLESDLIPDEPA